MGTRHRWRRADWDQTRTSGDGSKTYATERIGCAVRARRTLAARNVMRPSNVAHQPRSIRTDIKPIARRPRDNRVSYLPIHRTR